MRMEGVTSGVYKGIKGYWRRRGYERLNGGSGRRRKNRVELATLDGSNRRRRFWKIKLTPRLKLKLRFSPKKFIIGLRDAYVNMMMKVANARFVNSGFSGFSGYGIEGFGMRPLKEYDERMIVEIYKSLVLAQSQLVPSVTAATGSAVSFRTVTN